MGTVVAIESSGIGDRGRADCFAIADVLLRAIGRQLSPDAHQREHRREVERSQVTAPGRTLGNTNEELT